MGDARIYPLTTTLPAMCAWCTSEATCRVDVPTPEMERSAGRQRKAEACDRHALLIQQRGGIA